jgi:hypothetical protein
VAGAEGNEGRVGETGALPVADNENKGEDNVDGVPPNDAVVERVALAVPEDAPLAVATEEPRPVCVPSALAVAREESMGVAEAEKERRVVRDAGAL